MNYLSLILTVLFSVLSSQSLAATLYVATTGNDSNNNCTSPASECATIGYAISRMIGGDTLIIRDGTYSSTSNNIANIPSGISTNYTTIKAENDGNVIIQSQFYIVRFESYIQIEGLKFTGNTGKSVTGQYVKIFRCAFEGGPVSGNSTNLSFGTNNHSDTHHILLEDSWIYGRGGRYKLLVYQSQDIILRRVVIRPDGGWQFNPSVPGAGFGSVPEAGLNIYESENVQLQNVIVLDSMTTAIFNGEPESWTAAFYFVANAAPPSVPYPYNNIRIAGSIAFNNIGSSYAFDGGANKSNLLLENSAAWKPTTGAIFSGGGITTDRYLVVRNVTVINAYRDATANYGTGSLLVKNSILTNYNNPFYSNGGVSESYNVCFDTTNCTGTGDKNYNPELNGLSYITRIDSGSLQTDGEGGGVVGATIINKIGQSGTYYGDTNFNITLGDPLWPWSYETRMAADFCSASGVTSRGFCSSGKTFTQHIWESLGNPLPANLAPMSTPTNTTIIKN